MARLGGEYFDPRDGDDALPVQHARLVFYSRIERDVPDVLASLRDDVLPLFGQWAGEAGEYELLHVVDWWRASMLAPSHDLDDLRAALDAWAERWNLLDDWLLDDALSTLRTWHAHPTTLTYSPLHWHPDAWGGAVHEVDLEPCRPFEPQSESWDTFQARVDAWTDANRRAAEQLAAEHGLAPTPVKNAPRRTDDAGLHFVWLARYQCDEWTHKRIARHYKREYDDAKRTSPAVAHALQDTASLIGLTLR